MKIKHFLMVALCSAAVLSASAQSQGYLDGIEYYKADQFDNAREILERTLNDAGTDQSASCYYLGSIALRNGDVAAAKAYFDKGIEANAKNGLNYVGLGAVALKGGDQKTARDQFKAATKAQNTASVNVAIARSFYNADPVAYAKDYDKYMETAFKKDKKNTDIYIMRGDKLLAEDNVGAAAGAYDNAIYYNPGNPEAYVKYANAYIHANPKFAIEKLIELNNLAPNSALAQRELAEKYFDNDQFTRAAEQYGTYIKNPNHFQQDEERYVQLLYFGQKYDESNALAQAVLAKDPNSFPMSRMVFLNAAGKKEYPLAMELAQKFFSMTPPSNNRFTSNDYTTYGDVLTELNEDSLAIVQYEKAVEVNPEKVELLKTLSSAYYNAKNYPAAAEAYERFVASGEGSTNDIFVLSGRYMTAITAYNDSTEVEKRNEVGQKAIATIDRVLELVDNDYRIPHRKARILVTLAGTQTEESNEWYQRAIDLLDEDPENKVKRLNIYREAYGNIVTYHIEHGNKDEAVKYLELLMAVDTEKADIYQKSIERYSK
ncbi:MAG: tetratricopeptide repeat protein [Muribaculaceae bacterium]|nr:tetratricopeptide repeat protein [Muribaculaceae bacterium]MDE6462015.1 tetratricopeptide repeat protein [Muribaculaceae bacterium]